MSSKVGVFDGTRHDIFGYQSHPPRHWLAGGCSGICNILATTDNIHMTPLARAKIGDGIRMTLDCNHPVM